MQTVAFSSASGALRSFRRSSRHAGPSSKRVVVVKAEAEVAEKPVVAAAAPAVETKPAPSKIPVPEWVPAEAVPVLEFFTKDDFSLKDSKVYTQYLQQYVENPYVEQFTGFKAVPEVINGRAAMLGFVAAAGAEIFGAGSFLAQLSKTPQPVLAILALVVAASIIPIVKGTKGEYLDSLKETYTLPEGVFTEAMEKLHGRLAMVGVAGLLAVELLKASPLL